MGKSGVGWRWGGEGVVWRAEKKTFLAPAVLRIIELPGHTCHGRHSRRMSVEGLHFFKVIQILQKEFRLMGKLAEGQDTTIHGLLDEPRRKTSHQLNLFVPSYARTAAGSRVVRNSVRRFFCSWCKGRSGGRGMPPR